MKPIVISTGHIVRPKEAELDISEVGQVSCSQLQVSVEFSLFSRFVIELNCQSVAILCVNGLIGDELVDYLVLWNTLATEVLCIIQTLDLGCKDQRSC